VPRRRQVDQKQWEAACIGNTGQSGCVNEAFVSRWFCFSDSRPWPRPGSAGVSSSGRSRPPSAGWIQSELGEPSPPAVPQYYIHTPVVPMHRVTGGSCLPPVPTGRVRTGAVPQPVSSPCSAFPRSHQVPIPRDVMGQRGKMRLRFLPSFRCYSFESRCHDWLIFSLHRRPYPPFGWSSCFPRTIQLLLPASPCGRPSVPMKVRHRILEKLV
jgi:hypothetical protein